MDKLIFDQAIESLSIAFINSPTQGLIIWEGLLLSKNNDKIMDDLCEKINNFKTTNENKQKLFRNIVKNIQLIKEYVLFDNKYYEIVQNVKNKALKYIKVQAALGGIMRYNTLSKDK